MDIPKKNTGNEETVGDTLKWVKSKWATKWVVKVTTKSPGFFPKPSKAYNLN